MGAYSKGDYSKGGLFKRRLIRNEAYSKGGLFERRLIRKEAHKLKLGS